MSSQVNAGSIFRTVPATLNQSQASVPVRGGVEYILPARRLNGGGADDQANSTAPVPVDVLAGKMWGINPLPFFKDTKKYVMHNLLMIIAILVIVFIILFFTHRAMWLAGAPKKDVKPSAFTLRGPAKMSNLEDQTDIGLPDQMARKAEIASGVAGMTEPLHMFDADTRNADESHITRDLVLGTDSDL